MKKPKLLFDRIIYNGRPCRIVSVSKHGTELEDKDGNRFTVVRSELVTIDRQSVETR